MRRVVPECWIPWPLVLFKVVLVGLNNCGQVLDPSGPPSIGPIGSKGGARSFKCQFLARCARYNDNCSMKGPMKAPTAICPNELNEGSCLHLVLRLIWIRTFIILTGTSGPMSGLKTLPQLFWPFFRIFIRQYNSSRIGIFNKSPVKLLNFRSVYPEGWYRGTAILQRLRKRRLLTQRRFLGKKMIKRELQNRVISLSNYEDHDMQPKTADIADTKLLLTLDFSDI